MAGKMRRDKRHSRLLTRKVEIPRENKNNCLKCLLSHTSSLQSRYTQFSILGLSTLTWIQLNSTITQKRMDFSQFYLRLWSLIKHIGSVIFRLVHFQFSIYIIIEKIALNKVVKIYKKFQIYSIRLSKVKLADNT